MKNILLGLTEFGIFGDWYGNSYFCSYKGKTSCTDSQNINKENCQKCNDRLKKVNSVIYVY